MNERLAKTLEAIRTFFNPDVNIGRSEDVRWDVCNKRLKQCIRLTGENEALRAAVGHLREAGQRIVDESDVKTHKGTCHCAICELEHAMAVTGGFRDE